MNKGIILKTAAVVSCVVALGITGCQGGNGEAAAVKNKSNIEVSIHNTKGESVDVQRDGKEDIGAVGRRTEPAREGIEAGSSDTKPVNGYVGSDRRNGEASSNDNERSEEKGRTDPKADSKAEQPEDEDIHAGEKDRGTDSSSESLGAGDGFNAASAVSSISDMESTDSAGWDGWMENDSAVSEYSESGYTEQYDYDSTYQYGDTDSGLYEEPESGVDESGYADTEGEYDSEVDESADSYVDSNEQYGDSEYSEDTDNGWSDGAGESLTYLGVWASTGYCPGSCCCGVWASGYTASGTLATEGRTVACGSLPMGTTIYIEGWGYRVVEDLGVEGEWVDIFYSSHEAASAHGLQYVNVYLVN